MTLLREPTSLILSPVMASGRWEAPGNLWYSKEYE